MPAFADVQHAGMYGDMFEGLTQNILSKALFGGLDLRVVKGKIRSAAGELSRQLDCMVVVGEGKQLPFTDHYIYPFDKVIMVVEVKKTLFSSELRDAINLFRHLWDIDTKLGNLKVGLLQDAWRGLLRRNLPSDEEIKTLPFHEQMIYKTLAVEATLPVRVIFGFDGFTTEANLRKGVIGYFEGIGQMPLENRPKFNVNGFPNLIVFGKSSVLKLDGYPYNGLMLSDSFWCWLASKSQSPVYVLLEMLWTRLAYIFNLPPIIFGADLQTERVNLLCSGKATMKGNQGGWELRHIDGTEMELELGAEFAEWHSPTVEAFEFVALQRLLTVGEVDLSDESLLEFLNTEGHTMDDLVSSLQEKKLATINNGKLVPMTDKCEVIVLPDGRVVAAENKSGRLTNYAMRILAEHRARTDRSMET